MGNEEKQESNQDKKQSISSADSLKKTKNVNDDKDKPKTKSNYAKEKIKKVFAFWRSKTFGEKRDMILIIVNIVLAITATASLILVYYMTSEQNQLSRDALDRADTNIALTEESIIASDVSTKEALRISDSSLAIADSSMKISLQNTKIISDNARIELRPYVNVMDMTWREFFVGKEIIFDIAVMNAGKTPAYDSQIRYYAKMRGSGDFYDSDYAELMERDYIDGKNFIGAGMPYHLL